eukprot:PhM_4_TR4069/c0_g2_i1/m.39046
MSLVPSSSSSGGHGGVVTYSASSPSYLVVVRNNNDHAPNQQGNNSSGYSETFSRSTAWLARTVVGTSAEYWIPTGSEKGLLETIFLKSRSTVGAPVPVGSRPSLELARNFTLPDGTKIDLDQECFKLSRAQYLLAKMSGVDVVSGQVRGDVLKQGMRENLPKLLNTEYLIVRYRDYSSFAVSAVPKCDVMRDGVLGDRYVSRGFAIRTGQDVGMLIPLTELQYIHAAELTHTMKADLSPRSRSAHGEGTALMFLSEDQFRAALAVAESVKTARYSPEALEEDAHARGGADAGSGQGEGTLRRRRTRHWTFYLQPWQWRSAVNEYVDEQYRSVGRIVTRVAIVVGGLSVLYISIRGYRAFTGLVSFIKGPPPPPARPPRPRLLTVVDEVRETGDMRAMFDYLLAPKEHH